MSRIIVDEYPKKACECPIARYEPINSFHGRFLCNRDSYSCVIDEENIEFNYDEFVEEYKKDRQAYCRDHCPHLVDFKRIFENYIGEYDTQKYTDKESYYNW